MSDNHEGYRVVCCKCDAHLSGPKDAPPERTSHGLCAKCVAEIMREAGMEEDAE